MARYVLSAVSLMLCLSCAGPNLEHRAASKKEAERAITAFTLKAYDTVPLVDDKISDARTIALALTNACIAEYNAVTVAWGIAELDNDAQRRMFAHRRNSEEERIQASLNIVLAYRTGKLPQKPVN